ncbi:MAG: MBL fold metallo-hydrolase [Deltaproteobacteria bacterium]|nr:MBL fold metallo-hydrolase [Deltaproteobacteria bacterium]
MSGGLSFVALGVGDAFSATHYSSSLAVESDGRWILVDCPHPIRKMLHDSREATGGLDLDRVDAVLLTHLHADHCSGVEGLAYYLHFVLGRRVTLVAHPQVARRLWSGHLSAGMDRLMTPERVRRAAGFEEFFDLVPLSFRAPVRFGPFEIACRATIHHVPSTAFRIHAGGRTLGVSGDTAFDPRLIAWLAEADLIVHESNLGAHTPYEKLVSLPLAIRERMRLIHYPDGFDEVWTEIPALTEGVRHVV